MKPVLWNYSLPTVKCFLLNWSPIFLPANAEVLDLSAWKVTKPEPLSQILMAICTKANR